MRALLTIPFRRAAQQPVMFVVEDLHWIDPTTVEFLTLLVDEIADAPILARVHLPPRLPSPWTDDPNVTDDRSSLGLPSERRC